jgi:predicted unusual protein kinase regulating ubiquinone biosynthesis (AarF/ABC1/UbiB family)
VSSGKRYQAVLRERKILKEIVDFLSVWWQVEEKEAVAGIGEDLFAIALDQPFRFPASFTFVLRAFTTLEGFGRTLDPNYKFASVAQPYALELLQLQVSCLCMEFPCLA